MEFEARIQKLKWLIRLGNGQVESRKKLHKTVYLLQELGEEFGQSFRYSHFGVFSSTLASDLETARDTGQLEESETDSSRGFRYSISNDQVDALQQRPLRSSRLAIAQRLLEESPIYLEVLSTIVYLHRNGYSGKLLLSKVGELKPRSVRSLGKGHLKRALEHAKDCFGAC